MAICTPLFLNVNIEFHKMNLSNNGLKYSSISNCDETRAIGNNNDILYSITCCKNYCYLMFEIKPLSILTLI